jgi:N-acyl-D-amino-acid deacylase
MRPVLRLLLSLLLLTGGLVKAGPAPQAPPSILIRGGTVVDGTGARPRRADVRIVGDAIRQVGRLRAAPSERVIEARGLVVAPGFIDTHSHADRGLLEMPDAETQIRQGITTAVVGQDGGSNFPLRKFFDEVTAKRVALNVASFAGHGVIRRQVMGEDYKRAETAGEIARMREAVEQEMRAGALGLSSGLEYDPGFYSTTEELVECAKVAGQHGGLYISHVRDEANKAFEAFGEVVRVAEEARLPAQISHVKLGSKNVWGRAGEVLRLMEDARARGVEITADVYPYNFWSSTITVLIPTRDWENRAAWEKGLAEVGGPENVLLALFSPDPAWAGKTIEALSRTTGKDPVTLIQEIVRRTHGEGATGREGVVVTAMSEDDVRRFVRSRHVMFCSEGTLRGTHPRGAGTFPRILARYVREERVLSLQEAVRKMTGFPARRMGFHDRGLVKAGMKADLVLFDPRTVLDRATTAEPNAPPEGIPYVIVNGVPVLDNGKLTGERPGRVLPRSSRRRTAETGTHLYRFSTRARNSRVRSSRGASRT